MGIGVGGQCMSFLFLLFFSIATCAIFEGHIPIGSMYRIFAYIYHKNQPGKYATHGSYGIGDDPNI